MWLTNAYEGSWQHYLRSLDVLDGRNTTLEHDVDVHHMALADRCNVSTRNIALLVVVFIDDGDNLLLREVEDVRETAYVQRTGLRRSDTVYAEFILPVCQAIVVGFSDDKPYRNIVIDIICTCNTTCDISIRYSRTFCVLIHLIRLAAIVECLVLLLLGECQRSDIPLF